MIKPFPILIDKDCTLRAFSQEDLPLIEEASKDSLIPLITSIPIQYSEKEGLAFIERQLNRYVCGAGYSFAIVENETNKAIGAAYLGIENIDSGRASLGYWLIKSERGKGKIKPILKKLITWAQTDLKIPRLELNVEPSNQPSIKTAEYLGFEKEGVMRSWQFIGDTRKDMIMMSLINNS